MTVNGLRVGDPLTDNGWTETGYRWHDTLHLAHAMCLGWSPVFRGLAGLKRRSDPRLDHVEDGGRAAVADEAIAWAVFCHARRRGWYADRPPDGDLLDYVQEMTYALEVAARDRAEWAHAIRTGLACLRAVWQHGGGVLTGDLGERVLSFTAPLSDPGPGPSARPAGPTSAGTGSPPAAVSAGTPA
jgi:MazG C-terminal domain